MSNMFFALRSGALSALITASAMLLAIYFSPNDWKVLAALVVGATLIGFWVAFIGRLTGSDVLSELGLCYPDLRPQASIHEELAALRQAFAALERRLR